MKTRKETDRIDSSLWSFEHIYGKYINVDFILGFLTAKQMRVKYLMAKRVKIES